MKTYPSLDIRLDRRDVDKYAVEMVFREPGSEAPSDLLEKASPLIQLTPTKFAELRYNLDAYARGLSQCFFDKWNGESHPTALSEAWIKARSKTAGQPLRVRLHLKGEAQNLHYLHWEKLMDPDCRVFLALGEQVFFSRYLSSPDMRPVRPLGKAELRALTMVANPINLSQYQPGGRALGPLDVKGELARARTAMSGIAMDSISQETATKGSRASLTRLLEFLNKGYDILYLVCHGALIEGEPVLYLEEENGQVEIVSGISLIQYLAECLQLPRLVVLASCQSAGTGKEGVTDDGGALAALGPRLAKAGVPAVLAMQGDITVKTIENFMPVFFQELTQEGQIDRAVAIARTQVCSQGRQDWWAPVLFMRLESGELWYEPGFTKDKEMKKWPALLNHINKGRCTPILGPGLSEPVLGCCREIARQWAAEHHFPLAWHHQEDLTQVAQYLRIDQDKDYLQDHLIDFWSESILKRFGEHLPDHIRGRKVTDLETLREMIKAVGDLGWDSNEFEPHKILAELPFKVYISANPTSLMADALKKANKEPQVVFCRWREMPPEPGVVEKEPSVKEPLVYQLFGSLEDPESLLLTMDDYLDYLIAISKNMRMPNRPIPTEVTKALADNSLLFLGFQLDDWNFWVLFRFLMSLEGGRHAGRSSVAVQIRPEVGRFVAPEEACTYLEKYLGAEKTNMSVYWGNAQEFIKELHRYWRGEGQ